MRIVILAAAAAAVLAGAGVAAAQQPQRRDPAEVVKMWDTNGDGAVSKDEWVAAGRPADHFDAIDANHDGKITADELTQAMARMRQMRHDGAGEGGAPAGPPPAEQPH